MPPRSRDSYIVTSSAPDSLTFLFQRVADRLDALEGIRPELADATEVADDDDVFIVQDGVRKLADAGLLASYTINYINTVSAVRNVPKIESTGETMTTDGVGHCYSTTGNMTVPANVFEEGDVVSVYNATSGDLTLTQGTDLTLRLSGTATTGNRTLAERSLATVWFNSSTEAIVIGAGVT